METHKRIYLQIDPEGNKPECEGDDGITWCEDCINDTDVEYIRADLVDSHHADKEG